jgi:hypothetical protein
VATYVWFAIVLFTVLPATCELGFRFGRRMRGLQDSEAKSHLTTWEGGVLGLAGLLIGFTFSMAVARFDARKQIQLAESNAISTAILRTRMLDDARGEELRALFLRYVDARIALNDAGADRGRIENALRTSGVLQDQIWSRVVAAGRADPHSIMTSLLVESTNEMIDIAEEYVFSLENPVPPTVFFVLALVTAVAMGSIGFTCGLSGMRLRFGMIVMPLLLATVIMLVFDIAHPRLGIVRVHDKGLIRIKQGF